MHRSAQSKALKRWYDGGRSEFSLNVLTENLLNNTMSLLLGKLLSLEALQIACHFQEGASRIRTSRLDTGVKVVSRPLRSLPGIESTPPSVTYQGSNRLPTYQI